MLRGTVAASNLSLSLYGGEFSFQVEPRITRDRDGHGRNDGLKEKFSVACFSSVFLLSSQCLVFGQEEVPVTFGSRGGFFSPSFLKSPSSSMHTLPLLLQKYIKNPGTEPLGEI